MKQIARLFIPLAILFSSCGPSKSQLTNRFDETAVPKEILNKDYVLLVSIPYNSQKWIDKFTGVMEKHYAGKFEIVPYKKSISADYADAKKYRYILLISNSVEARQNYTPSGTVTHTNIVTSELFITDRADKNKIYKSNLHSANVIDILAFYADKLSGN